MENAELMIEQCVCLSGCPACVGPIKEVVVWGKQTILKQLRSDVQTRIGRDEQ